MLASDDEFRALLSRESIDHPVVALFFNAAQEEHAPFLDTFRATVQRWESAVQGVALDADRVPDVCEEFEVEALPMTMAFVRGSRFMDAAGALGEGMLSHFLNAVVKNSEPQYQVERPIVRPPSSDA